jgi:hypothetical protein
MKNYNYLRIFANKKHKDYKSNNSSNNNNNKIYNNNNKLYCNHKFCKRKKMQIT